MQRTFKTEALVIKKKPLLNKDNIITIFTEKSGKINTFAKGIKKITSRRLSHVQTGNLVKVELYKKADRFYLQETYLISSFTDIKKDPHKLDSLYFIFFILDRLLPENEKEVEIYFLIKQFLIELHRVKKISSNRLSFYLNRILVLLGYIDKNQNLNQLINLTEEIINEKIPIFSI